MATLSLDGPGQGEVGLAARHPPRLRGRRDGDPRRVGRPHRARPRTIAAVGVSLGGHYVIRAAAFEPRLIAIAGISGPFVRRRLGRDARADPRDDRPPHRRRRPRQARRRAQALDLDRRRRAGPPAVPGGHRRARPGDRLGGDQADRRRGGRPEWVLYPDGTHVCNNIPYKYRPLVADWISEHLAHDRRGRPRREDARVLRGETRSSTTSSPTARPRRVRPQPPCARR